MHQLRVAVSAIALVLAFGSQAVAEDQIKVPQVEGLQIDQAIKALEDKGFDVRLIEVAGPKVDVVATQDPQPGTSMRARGIVTIRVGIAARIETRLPDMRGKSIEDALRTLAPAYDIMIVPMPAGKSKIGSVVRTDPLGGAKVWFRAPVTIYVAERMEGTQPLGPGPSGVMPQGPGPRKAPDTPAIPDVPTPLPFPAPQGHGTPADLSPPGMPGTQPAPIVRDPRQRPGQPSIPGPQTGPAPVPRLIGLDHGAALDTLIKAGLTPEPWYFRSARAAWQVYSQKQIVGVPAAPGARISYRVAVPARLPAQFATPWVQTRALVDAIRTLNMVGLKVRIRGGSDVNRPDTWIAGQIPSPGAEIAAGSVVTLIVGAPEMTPRIDVPLQPVPRPPLGTPPTGTPPPGVLPPPQPGSLAPPMDHGTLPPPDIKSTGAPTPSVIGLMAADATAILTKAGLRVEVVKTRAPEAAPGRVFEQEPPVGLPTEGGLVRVVIPDGATTPPPGALYAKVPDIVNRSPADAEATVNATGLRAVIERGPEAPGVPSVAIAQSHHPGALIRHGTLVTVMIGAPPGLESKAVAPRKKKDRDPVERVGRFFRKTHKKAWGKIKDLFK